MNGRILAYSIQTNSGEISGDDGNRYTFSGQEWRETQTPARGMYVDFTATESEATAIFLAPGGIPGVGTDRLAPGSKSKTTAGILAILLGGLGIHKFYLGYTGVGILHILLIFLCGISALISLIEGIIYLTKSDEEFDVLYVRGNKSLF